MCTLQYLLTVEHTDKLRRFWYHLQKFINSF